MIMVTNDIRKYYRLCSLVSNGITLTPSNVVTCHSLINTCNAVPILINKVTHSIDSGSCTNLSYGFLSNKSDLVFLAAPYMFIEVPCEDCIHFNNKTMIKRYGIKQHDSSNNESTM